MAGLMSSLTRMRAIALRSAWPLHQAWHWSLSRFGGLGMARILLLLILLLASLLLSERCQTLAELPEQSSEPITPQRATDKPPEGQPALERILSPATDIPVLLSVFQQQARDNGLRLDHLEYHRDADGSQAFETLRVSMTLIGNADKLHGMVSHLLKDYPGLALVRLKLARERIDTLDIEGQLTWLFYLKGAPGTAEFNR
ncbi:MAG: hypothetical protein WBK19_20430 [Azonexus sp.]